MYNLYHVYGMKYELTFFDPSDDGIVVGVHFRTDTNTNDAAIGKDIDTLHERKLCQTVPLANTGSQRYTFSGYISMTDLFGITKTELMAQTSLYGANPGSNPAVIGYMEVFALDPAGNSRTVQVTGRLTYYAKLHSYLGPSTS